MSETTNETAFAPHPQREALLAEVHARPFAPMATPARILRFAFLADAAQAAAARGWIERICREAGLPGPAANAKHHVARLPQAEIVFEQHGEFTTYTIRFADASPKPFDPPAPELMRRLPPIEQPGPHLVSIDLSLTRAEAAGPLESVFDATSLAASRVKQGAATIATDFRADAQGFVRLLVLNEGLTLNAAGALCVRFIETETYRTFALLGLPEAQRLAPKTARIETELADISAAMTRSQGLADDGPLLHRLTLLAAELEADTAASAYRFGASRAYDELVHQRLNAIGEETLDQYPTVASFLARRGAPAMRTVMTIERRQGNLSEKLTRATNLLRTRVDVEIEQQNKKVLEAMNERASMQLRLQQTVEGLSIAAISYYVVGLFTYVFKGLKEAGLLPLDPNIATALAVPVAIGGVAYVVSRIRKAHSGEAH